MDAAEQNRTGTRLTLTNCYGEFSAKVIHDNLDAGEMFELFESLLLAAGYSQELIDELFEPKASSDKEDV